MEMEDLVHDLPLPIQLQQREHVSEARSRPVVDFQTHVRDRADDVDLRNTRLDSSGWTILVVPIVKPLDRSSKEIRSHISKNRSVLVEGGLHFASLPRFRAVQIMLNDLRDGFIVAQIRSCATHLLTPLWYLPAAP